MSIIALSNNTIAAAAEIVDVLMGVVVPDDPQSVCRGFTAATYRKAMDLISEAIADGEISHELFTEWGMQCASLTVHPVGTQVPANECSVEDPSRYLDYYERWKTGFGWMVSPCQGYDVWHVVVKGTPREYECGNWTEI